MVKKVKNQIPPEDFSRGEYNPKLFYFTQEKGIGVLPKEIQKG